MINILIVEDELIIAEDIAMNLQNAGYNVVAIAIDFDEAIDNIKTHQPDLILLDIHLAGSKSGLELAEVINEQFEIPFIFTTSYTDAATLKSAKMLKPINYLVKPFQKEQLFTAITIADFKTKNPDKISSEPENEEHVFFIKDDIFIKDKLKYTRLSLDKILYIKSDGNYLEIHTDEPKPLLIRSSMKAFLTEINRTNFLQTHKSYIINLNFLTNFEMPNVTIKKVKIPITKKHSEELLKRFRII
jgi:DNA-binding LytR/AlgR family response regulator